MAASPVISNKDFVTSDLLKLPKDIVIVLEDGQIEANKDLLSVRSDFFERSFNNPEFIESQSKQEHHHEGMHQGGHEGHCGLHLHRRHGLEEL